MGTITFSTSVTAGNWSKTFTDTDANLGIMNSALQKYYGIANAASAANAWAEDVIAKIVQLTSQYQTAQVPITPINPV